MTNISRRGFLGGILAAGMAPMVVKAGILMPVKKIVVPEGMKTIAYSSFLRQLNADFDGEVIGEHCLWVGYNNDPIAKTTSSYLIKLNNSGLFGAVHCGDPIVAHGELTKRVRAERINVELTKLTRELLA